MGRAIFISYRRDDTEGEAGRLFDDLVRAFGDNSVFMDVAGINPGMDFRKAIDDNVSGCGVLLAMIGPTWTTIAGHDGARRLDDANDFVRLEIASALTRNIAVIPVLVHDAKMPHPDELPDNLKDLAYRNSVEITHARWNSDVQLLIGALGQYVSVSGRTSEEPVHATVAVQLPPANPPVHAPEPTKGSKMPLIAGIAGAAVLVLAVIAYFVFHGQNPTITTTVTTIAEVTPDKPVPAPTPQSPLVGTWTNPTPVQDNGIKTIEILEVDGHLTMHAWGQCKPTDCDWGERTPMSGGNRLIATWGSPADGRIAKITVAPNGSKLAVLIENTYTNHTPITRRFNFDRSH